MRKAFLLTRNSLVFVLLLLLTLLLMSASWASMCRSYGGHQICIISIERSAKNYWEYKAAMSVDGVKQPIAIYNCRDRLKLQDKKSVQFSDNDPGYLICSFFKNHQ
ncbi:hypothetical protein Glo7428_3581 [Gloeocapsa sp. PCC 7428]|nr:hypothetical protein Glo7428_3581 [Gloeocapsa sp. PCC 7428]